MYTYNQQRRRVQSDGESRQQKQTEKANSERKTSTYSCTLEAEAEQISQYKNGKFSKEKQSTSGLESLFSSDQPIKLVSLSYYKASKFISLVKLRKYHASLKPRRLAGISLL